MGKASPREQSRRSFLWLCGEGYDCLGEHSIGKSEAGPAVFHFMGNVCMTALANDLFCFRLLFFGEVSIQVLCPLFKNIFY